jgi:hypothetical protein
VMIYQLSIYQDNCHPEIDQRLQAALSGDGQESGYTWPANGVQADRKIHAGPARFPPADRAPASCSLASGDCRSAGTVRCESPRRD